jgi:hypothetical protein
LVSAGTPRPVLALSLSDYFTYTYSFTFSKINVTDGENFTVTVAGQAICVQDLPLPVSTANIISKVVARNRQTGTEVILNPGYSISYDSGFPTKKGQTASASAQVPLSFPAGSSPGVYDVIGVISKAEVSVDGIPLDVTAYLPSTQSMGTINYSSSNSAASFMLSELSVTPTEVTNGKTITVTVLLSNNSNLSGNYEVVLDIDGQTINTQNIRLEGKSSQSVIFTHLASISGQHIVTIGGLSKGFSVVPSEPAANMLTRWLVSGLAGLGVGLLIGGSVLFILRRK